MDRIELSACLCLLLLLQPTIRAGAVETNCLDNPPVHLMAQLFFNEDDKVHDIECSALILTPHWLLAPASCLFDYNNPAKYQVKLLNNPTNNLASKIVRHPSFNNELGAGYDLALINVENKINPTQSECQVAVPFDNSTYNNELCQQLYLEQDTSSGALRTFKPRTVVMKPKSSTCDMYAKQVTDSALIECANKGVCRGQSGAVIICPSNDESENRFLLRGLSSWADIFCDRSDGYIYTNMRAYMNWIHSIIHS